MKKKCFKWVVLLCVINIVLMACGNKKENTKDDNKSYISTESETVEDIEEVSDSEIVSTEEADDFQSQQEQKPITTNPVPSTPTTSSKPEQTPSSTEDVETGKMQESESTEDVEADTPQESESTESTVTKEEYTVCVTSAGGHKLYNAKVNVYTDKSMTELVTTAATKSSGIATVELVPGDDYVFTLTNVPEGYILSSNYSFSNKTANVVLESSVVTGKDMPSTRLKVGHVMYDFTVPSAKGGEITLSEVLETKKLVVLNFWYVNCTFCVQEFPYMSSAYNKYSEDVEIIALNPFDSMDAVKTFLGENPLPFQVATCSSSLPNVFRIDAYPVSIVIDQYGVIREIEKGAILEEGGFVSLFERYL